MVVRAQGDGAIAVGQLSHAWLSGQLARAWGNRRFTAPQPREAVALGAEQHDIGWAQFDLAPRLNGDTGLPRNFLELDVAEHLAVWRHAAERLLSQSFHAALVVSLHGRALSELRLERASPGDAAALLAHIGEERTLQAQLGELLGLSADWLQRTQRQMWTWDGLSLALCSGWSPFIARDVPSSEGLVDLELRRRHGCSWTVSPWPFASAPVEVGCEARRIDARFADQEELQRAWQRPRMLALKFTLLESA